MQDKYYLYLERFWKQMATDEELSQLYVMLQNEENQSITHILEEVDEKVTISEEKANALLDKIHLQIHTNGKRKISYQLIWPSIAAAIIGVVFCIFRPSISKNTLAKINTSAHHSPLFKIKHNNSTQKDTILLADHSVVVLFPNATIRYFCDTTDRTTRSIFLEGSAVFSVAKNKKIPFTVYTKGLATTALGTKFLVKSINALTKVHLYNGKLWIEAPANATHKKLTTILWPGESIAYNNLTPKIVSTTPSVTNKPTSIKTDNLHANNDTKYVDLDFKNVALIDVFTQLSQHFKVPIKCQDSTVNKLNFTGNFLPTESIDKILTIVCQMNDLRYTKQQNNYSIIKQ